MKRLLLLFLLLPLWYASTAQEWLPLKAWAEADTTLKSSPAVCLVDRTNVQIAETGSGAFDIYRAVLIGNAQGALANRILKYDYDPLTAAARFTSVKVYRADGTVDEIPVENTLDYAAPARAIYWGARQIMIEIGALEAGDVVEYSIEKHGFTYALLDGMPSDDERFIPPMRGQFYDIVPFWVSEPTMVKNYTISVPQSKHVQYEFYQGTCSPSVRFADGRQILSFTVEDARPFDREPNMVDLYDVAPKLMLSSTDSWRDKSLWFHGVNEDYGSFDPTPEAQAKVDELIRGIDDPMRKIAVLTHWVADNMRYSGISMGKGEGYTLHNTRTNFTDRCGVCKDKAALLISMLRMAGFEAYPAMTMAGSRIEAIPADHFNHCVAVVKLSDGTYMPLDPTWVPFSRELWSSAEQQQNYLPGIPEGSDLCLTPLSAPENHYFRIKAASRLDTDGKLTGSFTVEAEGLSDASARRPFTTGMRARVRAAIERELLNISPQARLLSYDAGKNPADYQQGPLSMTVRFEIPDYAAVGDGVMICQPIVKTGLYNSIYTFLRVSLTPETRRYAFKDSTSRLVELDESITLPAGYTLVGKPYEAEAGGQTVNYEGSCSQSGATLHLQQRISLGKRVYDAADWTQFRESVLGFKEINDLVFEKSE